MGKLSISPSSLKAWMRCQAQWFFRITGAEAIKSPQLLRGSQVHLAIQEGESPLLENYYQRVSPRPQVLEKEISLSVEVGPYWITGRVDALAVLEDQLVIVDYKTGKYRPQSLFYQQIYVWLWERVWNQTPKYLVGEFLDQGIRKTLDPWPNIPALVDTYLIAAEKMSAVYEHGKPALNISWHCNWCMYRQHCLKTYPPESPNDPRLS